MSMMWPPQRVKIVSTPSDFSALATRCPPETMLGSALLRASVSSAVVLTGFAFVAASAMGILLNRSFRVLVLVEIVGVPGDVIGEPERVVAYQRLRQFRISLFERVDDVHVIADRTIHAIVLADRLAADHPHVREQVLRETIGEDDRVDRSIRDHMNIIHALEERDTERAENLVRNHALGLAEHVARHADYLD